MEGYKCPQCGKVQKDLRIVMECDISETYIGIYDVVDDVIANNSIWAEAECNSCSYSGSVESFELVEED